MKKYYSFFIFRKTVNITSKRKLTIYNLRTVILSNLARTEENLFLTKDKNQEVFVKPRARGLCD